MTLPAAVRAILVLSATLFVSPLFAESIGLKKVVYTDSTGKKETVTMTEAMRRQGVPVKPTQLAIEFFDKNANNFDNHNYLTIIDMQMHSSKDRFFLTNLNTGKVETYVVAHGRGSDPDYDGYATRFSNQPNSNATSLGFYQVSETYLGKHGYSARLDGLSPTNSNARARAIVIHGADYVRRGLAKQGRSFGCPALDSRIAKDVIAKVKNGSLLLMYSAPFTSTFVDGL